MERMKPARAMPRETSAGEERGETSATPPLQPPSGPGGAEYAHAGLTQRLIGRHGSACWVFTPGEPVAASAPVVVFFHGWSGVNPINYGGWIRHLVRRGSIVLYPVYQASLLAPFPLMLLNASRGVGEALAEIESSGPTAPSRGAVAFAGHSLGGLIAAKLAAACGESGLPAPGVLALVQPGWGGRFSVALDDLDRVRPGVLALVVAAAEDGHLPLDQPQAIYGALSSLPVEDRNFVLIRSDRHGTPPLQADHSAPLSEHPGIGPSLTAAEQRWRERGMRDLGLRRGVADALDFYGHWKLLDALMDAAFHGRHRDVALGDTPRQRFMGLWSDGVPVKEMLVTTRPDAWRNAESAHVP
jgi:acetyl esterase/lipase